jgi:hypothetical protein
MGTVPRSSAATHRHPATPPAALRPLVVSLHRAETVSGINAWGARMTRLGPGHARWHMLIVGEGITEQRAAAVAGGAPEWSVATWPRGAGAVEQVRAVLTAVRGLGAEVVAPNDVAHGFVCAALDHHRGLRSLAVCHACSGVDEDFCARVGALADAWVPVSRRGLERLRPWLARPNRALPPVVPCGVAVPAEPVPMGTGPGPLRLLFAGRLDQHCKRVLDLPVLCSRLDALGVDWTLTVAGDGSARAELARRMARFGPRASMLGLVPGPRMQELYAGADCLVLLSAFEGWPVTVIEALAVGRAVAVTTGCGGALDIVRDGVEGFVVPTGDMDGLGRRLASAGREGMAKMGTAAHAAARKHLNLRNQASVYDSLVASAQAAPARPLGWGAVCSAWAGILSALSAIEGPAPEAEVLSLLLEWLEDLGSPPVCADLRGGIAELLAAEDPAKLGPIGGVRGAPGWMGWPEGPPDAAVIIAGSGSGLAGPVLPLAVPRWPIFAGACLLRAVERLRALGVRRIVLYGAGRHTRRLGAALAASPEIVGIVDDRAGRGAPARLWGFPVVPPAALAMLGAQAVIISSDEHQDSMGARAREWAGGVPVVRLYGPDGYPA